MKSEVRVLSEVDQFINAFESLHSHHVEIVPVLMQYYKQLLNGSLFRIIIYSIKMPFNPLPQQYIMILGAPTTNPISIVRNIWATRSRLLVSVGCAWDSLGTKTE